MPDHIVSQPDCDPIDLVFAKRKTAHRRAQPRTLDPTVAATGVALANITVAGTRSFFTPAGYTLSGRRL